ncbi:hypothetical protein Sjap_003428 [Stephania japonica]|uniref:Uncharacterized protein n=1 Tax=Stephania japonica TaxID=461633 RepID=A0AAP0PTJ3_9MAGN
MSGFSATFWDFIGQTASHRPFPPIMRHKSCQSAVSTNYTPQIMPLIIKTFKWA